MFVYNRIIKALSNSISSCNMSWSLPFGMLNANIQDFDRRNLFKRNYGRLFLRLNLAQSWQCSLQTPSQLLYTRNRWCKLLLPNTRDKVPFLNLPFFNMFYCISSFKRDQVAFLGIRMN